MATRNISTKIAVEGESEYKRAIAACNSELSTLKSSLALVESSFKGNANSMEALTAKGAALESMYNAQKDKVATLEAALKNAQRAQEEYAARVSTARENIERCEKALQDLQDSTGDTTEEQAALTKELDKWNAELQEAQGYESAAERGVQGWQKQLNYANVDLNNLSGEIARNNQYLTEAASSADGCATSIDKYGKEVKEAADESEEMGDKSKEAFSQLAAALAAAGVAKTVKEITDALMECAGAAASFETSIAKVSTLADTSKVPMDQLKASLLSLSSETGASVEGLAEAAYQALSAGVDTANVVDFVATATKLSTAGFTESATAVDVLTTALNAYGLGGEEVERVASMLVKTQDLGKTSVDELAGSMGRVIPVAAAYGVGLDQLSTAYALITASGTNTAIATTNLAAMLNELASNSSDVAAILEDETGKSFADLMAEGKNLGDIMTILSDSVDGNSTAFSNLWSSSTAGQSALTLLNSGADKFNKTLGDMQESSGAVDRNFGIMADTTEHAQQRMTTAANNLKIAIGDQLTPALDKMYSAGASAFEWATDFVNENPWLVKAITAVTVGIGALAAGITLAANAANIAAVATGVLNAVMKANPAFLVAAGVTALVAAIGTFILTLDDADEAVQDFRASLDETKTAYEELSSTMEEEQRTTASTVEALQSLLEVEEKSEVQKESILNLVNQLNEAVPGLGLAYDAEKDSLEGLTIAEVESMVERAAAQEEYEAQVARLSELEVEQADIKARLTEAQEALSEAEETGAGNTATLKNNIDELKAAEEENAQQIAELTAASAEYGEAMAEQAAKTEEMTSTVEGIITQMEGLQAAYEESYTAAMESIDGQLGLFNELDGSAKTSIDSLIETLKGQVTYMEDYARNIQRAMELGVDEGLVKKLSDGSEESAQILAAIVEGGEEDIEELNEQLANVEKGKEDFSKTVAEMETDFDDTMEDLVDDLNKAFEDMDLSGDAYYIGENNIQGLIDGTASKKRELVNKYAEMGRAALAAYKREVEQASPSKKFAEAGRFDIQGIIGGAESEKKNLAAEYESLARTALETMETSLPSTVEEPRADAALSRQTAALLAASSGRGGGVENHFHIAELVVRDDSDVDKIARELYYMQAREQRSRGGGAL